MMIFLFIYIFASLVTRAESSSAPSATLVTPPLPAAAVAGCRWAKPAWRTLVAGALFSLGGSQWGRPDPLLCSTWLLVAGGLPPALLSSESGSGGAPFFFGDWGDPLVFNFGTASGGHLSDPTTTARQIWASAAGSGSPTAVGSCACWVLGW